jgi:hypothetical protein
MVASLQDAGLGRLCCSTVGMRIPVLRETRTPAVLGQLGPPRALVDEAPGVAAATVRALRAWCAGINP